MLNIFQHIQSLFAKKNTSEDFIYSCFKDALDFRYNVFLDFIHANRVSYQARAICIEVSPTTIRFQLRDEHDYIPAKSMKLSCFFVLARHEKKLPCTFSSQVITTIKDENTIFIEIEMPTVVVHEQRRNNVRIPITESEIPNFQIWSGRETETLDNGERRNKFVWDMIDKQYVQLVDISAGGLLLTLSNECTLYPSIKLNTLFLCSGNFYSPHKPETSLLLIAKLKRFNNHESDKAVTLALQFVRWAQISEEGTSWINVSQDEGVSFLGSWLTPHLVKFTREQKVKD